jgi:hypothetical protein
MASLHGEFHSARSLGLASIPTSVATTISRLHVENKCMKQNLAQSTHKQWTQFVFSSPHVRLACTTQWYILSTRVRNKSF